MRIVIDTSSLLALVRYYIPFEKDNILKTFFNDRVKSREIIVLDKVITESKRVAKGIIIEELNFLSDKYNFINTESILPTAFFIKDLENRLCYGTQKRKLSDIEFEQSKTNYLESADAKLVLFCLTDKGTLVFDKPILVTEETISENDKKLFKKLPEICKLLEIEHCNLPTLFKKYFKINFSDFLK
jgi:hypothetical protein